MSPKRKPRAASAKRRPPRPFDLERVRTAPLGKRRSLVHVEDFGRLADEDATLRSFLDGLPDFLAVKDLRALATAVAKSHRAGRGVVAAMGGHVVKTGCGPVVIDLAERGVVTAFALAGSTAIHDVEIALVGHTSEDVAAGLQEGEYGMSDETGRFFAEAAADAAARGVGLGRALGDRLHAVRAKHRKRSLLATAARLDVPATVHVAVGTDIVHMHPACDGAALGEATFTDFRLACSVVAGLARGCWLNLGSAVVLPEIFLKAITVARNAGHPVAGLTTGSFDMLRMYRPLTNVVQRPPKRGFSITGHHEIMLPLFRAQVLRELRRPARKGGRS